MIKIEQCRGCGRALLIHPLAGMQVRLEPDRMDVKGATAALLDGRQLWRVTPTSVTSAQPDTLEALGRLGTAVGPHVVQEHRCTATGRPVAPFAGKESNPAPKERQSPPVAVSTPSSGRPSRGSSAHSAVTRPSEINWNQVSPPCSACGRPCDDPATRVIFELGATLIDAFHADC